MKKIFALVPLMLAVSAFCGENDMDIEPGKIPGFAAKGVMPMEENGFKFVRLERFYDDPSHRARVGLRGRKNCKVYEKNSFNASMLARVEANRRNGTIMLAMNGCRLDVESNQALLVLPYNAALKKTFIIYSNPKKTPWKSGEWVCVHVNIDRQGDAALYVNGELSAAMNIQNRQDEIWKGDARFFTVLGQNRKGDADNPVAKMDLARAAVREGLMSASQIRKEAEEWLKSVSAK